MKTPTYRLDELPDDVMEVPDYDYDAFARLSPSVIDTNIEDPYRCPVSTPTVNRRASMKSRNMQPPFVTYTSLNRSLQIPNNINAPKYPSKYKFMKANRPMAKAQKKNFDCYFVRKIDKTVHIDAQTHSTWLSSLCAQPVDEIFTKYKRKSEANNGTQHVSRNNNSTPGEKALFSAWSSNASNRGLHSVASKYSKSVYTSTASRNSRTSFIDPNLRIYGYEPEVERIPTNVSFALMPSTPTSCCDADDTTVSSSRGSPLFQKVFKNNVPHNNADQARNTNIYTQYQRDKRFPEIRPRKSTSSPTRKRIISDSKEPTAMSTIHKKHYDLEESPMQIVCFGPTPCENSVQPSIAKAAVSKEYPYRLPKELSTSLPELQGAG